MQLRTLTVQAVGPFADRYTVDFADLAASGLFLLEGPTGSGKSTLIDAVVFALYGKVASSETSDDRLRSAYAPDDVPTVVDLTFEVGSGVYRVRRSPGYERAKRRGTGTTRQQPAVTLWRLGPDAPASTGLDDVVTGEVLSTRLDEAGAELQRVVGLDRAQFVQTIVLPQGEFARFLRADPEERRGLLQRIFGTQVYERLQQRLAELRREADQGLRAAREALAETVAHFAGAARLTEDEGAVLRAEVAQAAQGAATGLGATVEARVQTGLETLRTAAEDADARAGRADAAWQQARDRLDEAVRVAGLVGRRDALRAEQAALREAEPEQRQAKERLESARAAAGVRPLLTGADMAARALEDAQRAVDEAFARAPQEVAGLPGVTAAVVPGAGADAAAPVVALLAEARDRGLAEAAALDRLVGLEQGLPAGRRAVEEARAALGRDREVLAAHEAWLQERPAQRAGLVTGLERARGAAARVETLDGDVGRFEEACARVVALDEGRRDLETAVRRREESAEAVRTASAREHALRQAWVAGMAGELAAGLRPGEPCPVCGSREHPAPAVHGEDQVTRKAVTAAELERRAAEQELQERREAEVRLTERVGSLAEQVGDLTAATAQERLDTARTALDAARRAEQERDELEAALVRHDEQTADRREQRDAAQHALVQAESRVEQAAQRAAAEEAEVAQARDGYVSVSARQAALRGRAEAAGALREALEGRLRAARQQAERQAELTAGLAAAGIGSVAAARAALLDPEAMRELDAQVAAHAAAWERVVRGLQEPELVALPDEVVVDVEGAREAERVARESADEQRGLARVARERAEAAEKAAGEVLSAARTVAERAAGAAPVSRLADLAAGSGGDNPRRLSLPTYVLMRRFEDVVAAANARLVGMSDGRYELVRSDEKEDVSTRRTGLAMRVVDHWTGQQRDPRTLSGGESFYVSLCLALGLADVVTAEAGGIELGTLFVDEGFGSLDPHTLDQVLGELGRLRAGGRVVGVVSHVEALKQSIADRIEVRPTPGGPSRLSVLAGGSVGSERVGAEPAG